MDFVIGFAALAVLVGGYLVYRSQKNKKTNKQPDQLPAGGQATPTDGGRSLLNLQIDDIVSHLGTDYIVEGRIDYKEGAYQWVEYMLADGETIRWLCVEDDDQLEVSLWEEIQDLHVTEPVDEILEYEGNEYKMIERGEAQASQKGDTGRKRARSVDYYDYRGPDDLLGVEVWGGEVEVFQGEEVDEVMLEVFPGS